MAAEIEARPRFSGHESVYTGDRDKDFAPIFRATHGSCFHEKELIAMAIHYRRKHLVLLLVLSVFCLSLTCYILPFFQLRLAAPEVKAKRGEQLAFHLIAQETIKGETDPKEQVTRLQDYINRNIDQPSPGDPANDVSRLHILRSGEGYCDQQVNVLLGMCEVLGLRGRMVWLFGDDSVSGHTVAEVFYDGSWHMFDPFYRRRLFRPDGAIASVEDIINRRLQAGELNKIPPEQQRHYGKRYPPETAPRTPVTSGDRHVNGLLSFNSWLFGRFFYQPWLQQCVYYPGLPFMQVVTGTISGK